MAKEGAPREPYRVGECMIVMGKEDRETVNFLVSECIDRLRLRKLLEYGAYRTNIRMRLWPPGYGSRSKKENNKGKRMPTMIQATGIVIREEGKSYAELVKRIKKNVKPEELRVKIRNMRKTVKGDVLVFVEGGKKNAGVLKGALKEKVAQAVVKMRSEEKTLSIMDIDPDEVRKTSPDEVKKAIGRVLSGQKPETLEFTSFREARNGNLVATVVADKISADVLLRSGRIAMGWLQCRVRENGRITRCYKCLGFGHLAKGCEGPNRTGLCFKCGGEGHKAQDCRNQGSCILCKEEGHRADTARCPKWREATAVAAKSGGRKGEPPSK